MREMKDSGIEWIGRIPCGWSVKKARWLFRERNEKGNPINIQLLTPSQKHGVLPQKIYQEKTGTKPVQVGEDKDLSEFKTLRRGDFCISLSAYMGGFEYSEYEGVISPAYHSFYSISETIRGEYYRFLFKSPTFIDVINLITPQSVRVGRNTSFDSFKDVVLPVPPLSEQSLIADYLDDKCRKIDAIITQQERIIEKLVAYRLSFITEIVTKGKKEHAEYVNSNLDWIGIIPKSWSLKKLKYASDIMRGRFNHRPRNDPRFYDGAYPFVQTGDVARAGKYITGYSQTLNELGYEVSKEFPKGSICMTIAANVGDVAILDFDACFPDSVVGFVPVDGIYRDYLFFVFKAMKQQLTRNAIISTQLNLNIEIIKEEFIPVPPIEEQIEIAEFLNQKSELIDKKIDQKKAIIDKLNDYKKSLIYEAVTGKKEVC